jgi:acetoacetyl-CoA synthetase
MTAAELWRHERPEGTQMWRFLEYVNSKYSLDLKDYPQLYKWSVDNVADFWGDVWHFAGIKASKTYDQVLPSEAPMFPRPDFFAGARLNFAENLLFPANVEIDESVTAVITATEDESHLVETSWAELRDQVRRCSNALRSIGVKENSVVAGFVANHVQALVALLSAATVGAIWTGISPDNGVSAVLDRLTQIRPQVLFTDNATLYNGKEWSGKAKTLDVVEELKKHGLEQVVVIKALENVDAGLHAIREKGVHAEEFNVFLDS